MAQIMLSGASGGDALAEILSTFHTRTQRCMLIHVCAHHAVLVWHEDRPHRLDAQGGGHALEDSFSSFHTRTQQCTLVHVCAGVLTMLCSCGVRTGPTDLMRKEGGMARMRPGSPSSRQEISTHPVPPSSLVTSHFPVICPSSLSTTSTGDTSTLQSISVVNDASCEMQPDICCHCSCFTSETQPV